MSISNEKKAVDGFGAPTVGIMSHVALKAGAKEARRDAQKRSLWDTGAKKASFVKVLDEERIETLGETIGFEGRSYESPFAFLDDLATVSPRAKRLSMSKRQRKRYNRARRNADVRGRLAAGGF